MANPPSIPAGPAVAATTPATTSAPPNATALATQTANQALGGQSSNVYVVPQGITIHDVDAD
jgi:hypothetical protein